MRMASLFAVVTISVLCFGITSQAIAENPCPIIGMKECMLCKKGCRDKALVCLARCIDKYTEKECSKKCTLELNECLDICTKKL